MRKPVIPEFYTDITSVIDRKEQMLALHKSQKAWLDKSQGLDAYLNAMKDMSSEVGWMSHKFKFAEGWRRHSHLGFSANDIDPVGELIWAKVVKHAHK